MILVAGLAVAGLVGIAAAFYFSIRSGNGGNKRNSRVRSGGSGRAGTDGHPGGRRSRGPGDDRPVNGRRAANNSRAANPASGNYGAEGRSGPNTVTDFGDAVDPGRLAASAPAPAGRRTRADSRPPEQVPTLAAPVFATGNLDDTPGDAWPGDPGPGAARPGEARSGDAKPERARPGSRTAARLTRDADPADQADQADPTKAPRSRRRVGFRKGADIDEEMWPTEAFGGVTDDQFWDDMASDKPLTTTARSAQHDTGSPKRPLAAIPPPGARPAQKPGGARSQSDDGSRGRRARNPGGYPDAQPGVADRTAVQPVQSVQPATQPVPSLGQPAPVAPARAASFPPGSGQAGSGQAGHLSSVGGPYQRTGPQPSQPRGWRHASGSGAGADEDPLTSAAFSLRSSGPVDGHSQQAPRRSREVGWDHYDVGREHYGAGRPQETPTFSATGTEAASGGYSGGVPPFRALELPAGSREPRGTEPRGSEPGGASWAGPSGTAAVPAYGPGTAEGTGSGQAYGGTTPYPYGDQPYRDTAQETSATAPADTPPYGESYGYGNPAAPAEDPRRPNGARSHARHSGDETGNHAPRSAYQPGNGQNQGGYNQGNSYQSGPYDPREDYRRLTSKRLSQADWSHARGRRRSGRPPGAWIRRSRGRR